MAGNYGFNANIAITFQAVKNLSVDFNIYVLGCFVRMSWSLLGISVDSFSQRMSKIIRKFVTFDVFNKN